MPIETQVPFYENPDKTHCFQAVFRMAIKHCRPDKDHDWRELDTITAKVDGFWTWPTAGVLWLHANDFEIIYVVGPFDYDEFANKGGAYLIALYGEEVGNAQINHCDLSQEIRYAKAITRTGICSTHIPTIPELKARLDQGYLLICNVNSRSMRGKKGYSGHFILVSGYTADGFIIQDPGPPGIKNWRVTFNVFKHAWAFPDENAKNYIAIRRKTTG